MPNYRLKLKTKPNILNKYYHTHHLCNIRETTQTFSLKKVAKTIKTADGHFFHIFYYTKNTKLKGNLCTYRFCPMQTIDVPEGITYDISRT